jgi:hypothetical protein
LIDSVQASRLCFPFGNAELEWSVLLLNPNLGASTMKKQIVQVSPLQSAKVMAILYLVTSIPIALLMAIPAMLGGTGMSLAMLILMPLLYMVCGFLFTLLGAWVYNQVASRVGGFEFMTTEIGAARHQ